MESKKPALITSFFKRSALDCSQLSQQSTTQEEESEALSRFVFPLVVRFPVVAKFLCSQGRTERYVNFAAPHEVFLEREPENKYDPRAVKVGIRQQQGYLL